jgi:hypothetical protein
MDITDTQKSAVAEWFEAGASLDEIQKRLKSEFGVHVTYLDLRLMVAELPQPQEEEPETPQPPEIPEEPDCTEGQNLPETPDASTPPEGQESPEADVALDLDAITIPGTMASGGVTFSDGTKGKWYLDGYGRLGLDGIPPGYRPNPADAALFQTRLMELLRGRGMI